MKHFFIGTLVALMLVLAMVVGTFAMAESAAPEVPAAADAATDDTALPDALNAYRAARRGDRYDTLEEALRKYVEAGKLTQEQADLILNHCKERQALRDGDCPNDGTQTRNGYGKGGRPNGSRGGQKNGNKSGRPNGGRGGRKNGGN